MKSNVTKFAAIGECMLEFSVNQATQYQLKYAGDTFNVSLYLARYAQQINAKIDYITVLGDDHYSKAMLKYWTEEGLGIELIAQLPDRLPGLYLIHNDNNGERYFHFYRDQAAAKQLLHTPLTEIMLQQLPNYDYLYLSSISFAILAPEDRQKLIQVLQQCQQSKIIFDPNYRKSLWQDEHEAIAMIKEILPLVDIGLPTLDNEQEIFADHDAVACAMRWHAAGVKEVIVKQGGEPCLVSTDEVNTYVAADKVMHIVDTTAAGDSFNAAYLAARINGLPPEVAVTKAHQLAATVIQHHGAIVDKAMMPNLFGNNS